MRTLILVIVGHSPTSTLVEVPSSAGGFEPTSRSFERSTGPSPSPIQLISSKRKRTTVAGLRSLRYLGLLAAMPGAMFLTLGVMFGDFLEALLGICLVAGGGASLLKPAVASILVILVASLGAATTVMGVGLEHWDTTIPRCLSSIVLGVKVGVQDNGVDVTFWSDPQRNAAYISSRYGAPIIYEADSARYVSFSPRNVEAFLRSVTCETSVEKAMSVANFQY